MVCLVLCNAVALLTSQVSPSRLGLVQRTFSIAIRDQEDDQPGCSSPFDKAFKSGKAI